jgi:hypothetical protein
MERKIKIRGKDQENGIGRQKKKKKLMLGCACFFSLVVLSTSARDRQRLNNHTKSALE